MTEDNKLASSPLLGVVQTDAPLTIGAEVNETSAPGTLSKTAIESASNSDSSVTVTPTVTTESPLVELGAQGLDVDACIKDAIASLQGPQFNAVTTAERSVTFWTNVEPAKRELLERVRRDMGGVENAPETLLALQEAFVEASLFRRSMWFRLTEGPNAGPITNKGKTRALYTAYVQAIDRESKLAQLLGLERKPRKIGTVSELLS